MNVVRAPAAPSSARVCWVVSDGRIGMENQALGLAEAVARRTPLDIRVRRVPRSMLIASAGRTVAAAGDATGDATGGATGPCPDLWIGCGRSAVAAARRERRVMTRTRFVYVQDPKGSYDLFNLIIAPEHDALARANALSILGAPNRITAERLAEAASAFRDLNDLPRPRIAALLGGTSKRHRFAPAQLDAIVTALSAHAQAGGSALITTSRRTPAELVTPLRALAAAHAGVRLWTGAADGPNPYLAFLAHADSALVTQDSVNMLTDAASAGLPVVIAPMAGRDGKLAQLYDALIARDAARWFAGDLTPWPVTPLAETARAAEAVAALLCAEEEP